MKNIMKVLGIIVIAALASAACTGRNGSGSGGRSAALRESPVSDFSYSLTDDGRGIRITRYTAYDNDVVIPATIEDMPVLEIGDRAFGADGLSETLLSVVVPNGVEIIGRSAFSNKYNLRSVTLPDSVRIINRNAFYRNPHLTSVNLPANSDLIIADDAFRLNPELTDLVIPASLTSIRFVSEVSDGTVVEFGTTWDWDEGSNSIFERPIESDSFRGCQKLPLRTRQRLQELGYKGEF